MVLLWLFYASSALTTVNINNIVLR